MTVELLQNELEGGKAALAAAEARIEKLNEEINELKGKGSKNQAEHAVNEANNRFKELITNLQNGVFLVDENRKIVVVNEMFCKMFDINVPPEALIGSDAQQIIEQVRPLFKNQEKHKARVDKILSDKKKVLKEELEMHNGQIVARDYIPIFLNGAYSGHLWKFTDITRNKTIEATFEAQRLFYEQILNNVPADIIVCTAEYKYLYVNRSAVSDPELRKWMIGKSNEEFYVHAKRPQSVAESRRKFFDRVVSSKSQGEWEEALTLPDGSIAHYLRKMYPVLDDKGEVEIVVGYGIDITERKKIEEQIKLSEKRYRDIFNYSQAWICTHDMDGKILSMNRSACEILGYEETELLTRTIASFIPERFRGQFADTYMASINSTGKAEGIMSVLNRGGKKIYLLYQNFLVKEPGANPYVIGFSQDITERVHMEEALKRSEEKYRGIIENMNLGMIEIDTEENIVYANQRFCTMCEYSLEELTGKKATDLFLTGARIKRVSKHILQRAYAINKSYELAVKTKSGEDKWWLISAAPVFNNDKTQKGTIGIHLDITQQKKMEQQLKEAKQLTEKIAKSKDTFLTNVSHEIRTPLNAIMGLGKLLGKSPLDTQQKNYLNGIESASESLLGIINDLLDFSKIEAGKITIEYISFNLETISGQLINILSHKADEKGLLLTHEIDPRIAPMLIGDPYRINQVFTNMLSNAIKFTEKGSISLKASLVEESNNSQKIIVEIQDTGIGIKEEYIEHLFDKFTQEDETVVRKFGGTGLGMSITRQLMELMGGTISVKSKKNVGTTISLIFNLKIGMARVIEKKSTIKNDTSNITNKKILLVEDNNLNRLLASTILAEYGAIVTEAINGQEAVDLMRKEQFDIVLMDIQMPVMDGIQATQIIRKEISSTVPILALTANVVKGKIQEFLDAGMDDYIYKPYDEIKLVNPIAKWLNKKNNGADALNKENAESTPEVITAPLKENIAVADNTEPAIILYDLTKLKDIGRNDTVFITKMVHLFIEEIPTAVRKIKEAYGTGDMDTIKYLSHRIKPSILNMGINSLKTEILQIEAIGDKPVPHNELGELINKLDHTITIVMAQLKSEYPE